MPWYHRRTVRARSKSVRTVSSLLAVKLAWTYACLLVVWNRHLESVKKKRAEYLPLLGTDMLGLARTHRSNNNTEPVNMKHVSRRTIE